MTDAHLVGSMLAAVCLILLAMHLHWPVLVPLAIPGVSALLSALTVVLLHISDRRTR